MALLNTDLASDIRKYGNFDFSACYNCGHCTAVCSLTEKDANFPRMMVRYTSLGLQEEILSSKELWLCYACGDCTSTCPREAAPGELMASLRRYAIANYEKTGLTKLIFKNNLASLFITLLMAVILGFFLLTIKPEMEVSRWLFNYLPYEVIHNLGIVAMALMVLSAFIGVFTMWKSIARKSDRSFTVKGFFNAVKEVIAEVATFKRYQQCDAETTSYWAKKPNYVQPWFVHWSIMWGFIGLLMATILDFLFKDPAVSIWWPSRILGTIAGLFMVYGSSLAIYYRLKKVTSAYTHSRLADWMFLSFLWLAGITGFWLEIAVAFDADLVFTHVVFLIHVIISMQLVILFAFSKFAHAFYRPLALLFHVYK